MGRFKRMNRRERRQFIQRKAEKFGLPPLKLEKRFSAKEARQTNKALNRNYWDTGDWATDPLTRRQVTSEAKSTARLKYQPVLRELRDELQGSARQQRNIDAGFDLYKRQMADLSARQAANTRMATQQAFNQANTMSQGDQATAQQLDQQAAQSAAMRGATPGASDASGQASRARQMLQSSFGALLANQGLAGANRLLEEERIGDRQRISEHQKELGYARDLKQKRRETKLDRGDFLRDFLNQQRENERRYGLERKAFGLERKAQKADIRDEKRNDRLALIQELNDAKQAERDDIRQQLKDRWDMTDDQIDNALARQRENRMDRDAREESHGPSGGSRFTPTQRRANRREMREVRQKIRGARDQIGTDYQGALSELVEKGYDPLMVKVAMDLETRGWTDPGHAKDFRKEYGFKVNHQKSSSGGGGGANQIAGAG